MLELTARTGLLGARVGDGVSGRNVPPASLGRDLLRRSSPIPTERLLSGRKSLFRDWLSLEVLGQVAKQV